jgi:hypothetical protein
VDDRQLVNLAPTELYDPKNTAQLHNTSASAHESAWSNGH